MKKIYFTLLSILMFYCGCKKNESNPVVVDPPRSLVVGSISGKLDNWIYGRSYIAEFGSFGQSQIDEYGKFIIMTLANPADNQLRSIVNYFDSTVTIKPAISDQTARYYIVPSITLSKSKNPGKAYGVIQEVSERNSKDNFSVSYIYFDKACTFNGTASYSFSHGSWLINRKDVYKNLTFERGWNKLVVKTGSFDNATHTITSEILREEPSEGIWAYTEPQTIVTIEGSAAQAGLKYPLCVDNGYKRSAALYTSQELHASGIITKLAWKALTRTSVSRPIRIYIKEVDNSTLSPDSISNVLKGATQVYESTVTLATDQWNWNEFVLMDAFRYSGNKNLLVIVETNYGNSGATDDCYFEYSILNEYKFMTWSQNNSQPAGKGAVTFDRPNIRITIDPE